MEYRPLDITLISADGIKNVNMFGKMDVYAVSYVYGCPQTKKEKTTVERNCGTSPRWNQKLRFIIEERYLSYPGLILVIKLKAHKSFRPNKDIGHVAVPFPELFKNLSGCGESADEIVVECQVKSCSGKPKGTLRFSYKFGDKLRYINGETKKADKPVTAYRTPRYRRGRAGVCTPSPPASAVGMVFTPHPGMGYQQLAPGGYPGYAHHPPPPPAQGYYGAYTPPGGYPQPGYGYAPPRGYGYQQLTQEPKKKNHQINK